MTRSEILVCAPILVLRMVYDDMLKYAYGIARIPDFDFKSVSDPLTKLAALEDPHIRQIYRNLQFTATAITRYTEANGLDLTFLNIGNDAMVHAKNTWKTIMIDIGVIPIGYNELVTSYGSKNYLYCIAIWNCAYQLILNEKDVYNNTIAEFFAAYDNLIIGNTNYGDHRTAPLFKLISQIGDFRVNYES